MKRSMRMRLLLLLAGSAVAALACGGDDETNGSTDGVDAGSTDKVDAVSTDSGDPSTSDGATPDASGGSACESSPPHKLPGRGVLARAEQGYGFAAVEEGASSTTLTFTALSPTGVPTAVPVVLTSTSTDGGVASKLRVFALTWMGDRFALAWGDVDDRILLSIIRPDGARVVPDVELAPDRAGESALLGPPRMVWTGDELGITFRALSLRFQRRANDGALLQPLTAAIPDVASGAKAHPSLSFGDRHAVVWTDGRGTGGGPGLYLAELDTSGQKVGVDVRVNAPNRTTLRTGLAWTGGVHGVAWETNDSNAGQEEVIFARVTSAGVQPGELHLLGRGPWVTARGSEFALVLNRIGIENGQVYLTRIDRASGARIGADLRVTQHTTPANVTVTGVWSMGEAYGVSWLDTTNEEAWFREICPD